MARILLVCNAGMSTSLLVQKMKKSAAAQHIAVEIEAHAAPEFEEIFRNYDAILLGPQVRYQRAAWAPKAQEAGIPLDVINPLDYGTVNGEKVLEQALTMAASKK